MGNEAISQTPVIICQLKFVPNEYVLARIVVRICNASVRQDRTAGHAHIKGQNDMHALVGDPAKFPKCKRLAALVKSLQEFSARAKY